MAITPKERKKHMWLVQVYDTEPGFEGKTELGPFFSEIEANEAAENERMQADKSLVNPNFVRVYVKKA